MFDCARDTRERRVLTTTPCVVEAFLRRDLRRMGLGSVEVFSSGVAVTKFCATKVNSVAKDANVFRMALVLFQILMVSVQSGELPAARKCTE